MRGAPTGRIRANNAMTNQGYHTLRLAIASGMRLTVAKDGADVVLTANPGGRHRKPGFRFQVPGFRCQVSGAKFQVPSFRGRSLKPDP